MFTTFRKLFGKRAEAPANAPVAPRAVRSGSAQPPRTGASLSSPRANGNHSDSAPRPAVPVGNLPTTFAIPLKSVISRLPADLMQRVRHMDVGEAEVFIPMQKILSQIAQGAVKISFGELRQSAPAGTFAPENDRDRTLIELPLAEILSRLTPGLLARRPSQRRIEIPQEVVGPFGNQTKITICTTPLKSGEAAQPAARSEPAEMPVVQPSLRPQTFTPPPQAPQPARAVQPPAAAPVQPIPSVVARVRPTAPALPVQPTAPQQKPAPTVQTNGRSTPGAGEPPMFTFKRNDAPSGPVPAPSPIAPPTARNISPIAPQAPTAAPGAPNEPGVISMPSAPVRNMPISPIAAPMAPAAAAPAQPVGDDESAPIAFNMPAPKPAAPVAPAAPAAPVETRFLMAPLAALSETWPEALRQEIKTQNLSSSMISLPMGVVEIAIKQGKLAFPWRLVRSWIKPAAPMSSSAHEAVAVELPMKVITPLFLTELKATRAQKKIAIDENIPDLFSDARNSESPAVVAPAAPAPAPTSPGTAFIFAPAPAKPAPYAQPPLAPAPIAAPVPPPLFQAAQAQTAKTPDTNYYNWKDTPGGAEDSAIIVKKNGSPGTEFLNRYATPNEIVIKAASLHGVDGALIALPDGLLVASKIPASMNADTIAAFLPQIFGKVSQCTRELRLGDLNNLNFTVGNVPWKIFRVGSIYFAAFGRPGEAMPTAQLAGIAAELDRKAK